MQPPWLVMYLSRKWETKTTGVCLTCREVKAHKALFFCKRDGSKVIVFFFSDHLWFFMQSIISHFWFLSPAVCAEQPPGGEEHAAAEPSAGLCSAAGPSGHADRWPRDSLGERRCIENEEIGQVLHDHVFIWSKNNTFISLWPLSFHIIHVQKMLHRQTSVPPLIPSGQGGGAPPVNPPPAQPSVPVSQPQPVVCRTE